MKKRKVKYVIYGENDSVLHEGECCARSGSHEVRDILDHASIDFDDMWSIETTESDCAQCGEEKEPQDLVSLFLPQIRKEGDVMALGDMVLFDELFVPLGFTTSTGHYYAGQTITGLMTGKVFYNDKPSH